MFKVSAKMTWLVTKWILIILLSFFSGIIKSKYCSCLVLKSEQVKLCQCFDLHTEVLWCFSWKLTRATSWPLTACTRRCIPSSTRTSRPSPSPKAPRGRGAAAASHSQLGRGRKRRTEEDLRDLSDRKGRGGGRVSCSTRLFVKNNFKFLLSSQEMQLCTPRTTEQRHTCVFPFVARRVEAALCLSAHVHLFSVSESRCPSRALPSPRHLWDIQNATAANVNSSQYDLKNINNLFSSPPPPLLSSHS